MASTRDFAGCSHAARALASALASGAPGVIVVGGPGCGKSSFARALLAERGFVVADASELADRAAVARCALSLRPAGGLLSLFAAPHGSAARRAVWLDDNLAAGAWALEAAAAWPADAGPGPVVVATATSRALARYAAFRRACRMVRMNFPPRRQCEALLRAEFPDAAPEAVARAAADTRCSVPRARHALANGTRLVHVEDLRRSDMSPAAAAESAARSRGAYDDVRALCWADPVLAALTMREMGGPGPPRADAARATSLALLAAGDRTLAEAAAFAACAAARAWSARARRVPRASFPACYTSASSRAGAQRRAAARAVAALGLAGWSAAALYG